MHHDVIRRAPESRARSRSTAIAAVLALAASGVALSSTPAAAAELGVTLSDTQLRWDGPEGPVMTDGDAINEWGAMYFTTDFALAAAPTPLDTFTIPITLSPALRVTSDPFPLKNAGGTSVATCAYEATPSAVTCVFNDNVSSGDQEGFLWYMVSTGRVTEDTQVSFSAEGFAIDFTVENTDQGGEVPWQPYEFAKYGWSEGGNRNGYSIEIGEAGFALDEMGEVTITDRLQRGTRTVGDTTVNLLPHTFVQDSFSLSCFEEGAMMSDLTPHTWPASWAPVFNDLGTEFSLTINPTLDGGIPCGSFSRVQIAYRTQTVGDLVMNTPASTTVYGYGNAVDVGGFTATANAVSWAAGGGGVNNSDVMFSIVKAIDGAAAGNVAADVEFAVEVSIEGIDEPRRITFTSEGASFSGPIPDGRAITIREIDLPEIDGVEWDLTPTLTGESVVDNGDGSFSIDPDGGALVALILTNTADVSEEFGSLTVSK